MIITKILFTKFLLIDILMPGMKLIWWTLIIVVWWVKNSLAFYGTKQDKISL